MDPRQHPLFQPDQTLEPQVNLGSAIEFGGCLIAGFVVAALFSEYGRSTLGFRFAWIAPGLAVGVLRTWMQWRAGKSTTSKTPQPLSLPLVLGLFQTVSLVMVCWFGAAYLNQLKATLPPEEHVARLVDLFPKDGRINRRHPPKLQIQIGSRRIWILDRDRIDPRTRDFQRLVPGELVRVRLRPGALGLPYVIPDRSWTKQAHPSEPRVLVDPGPLSADLKAQLETAMHTALQKGDLQEIDGLLQSGADPNALDTSARPAFFAACAPALLKAMIEHGADLGRHDGQGRTLLFALTDRIHAYGPSEACLATIKLALRRGADPFARNPQGTLAWDYMRQHASCQDPIAWDLETRLLVEEPESPLLARQDEPYDFSVEGPRVHLEMAEPSTFDVCNRTDLRWVKGDRWYPSRLDLRHTPPRVGFEGELLNRGIFSPCAGRVPHSLQAEGAQWSIQNADGARLRFPAPRAKVALLEPGGFLLDPDQPLATRPSEGPDLGFPGFRGLIEIPLITAWTTVPAGADPRSARIRDGKWVFRKAALPIHPPEGP